MAELVRLKTRPSRDGKTFKYRLDYIDEKGKRRRISLGHADKRKAECYSNCQRTVLWEATPVADFLQSILFGDSESPPTRTSSNKASCSVGCDV